MAKTEIKHCDKLGSDLTPGEWVVAPYGNRQTVIAQVIKLNPKMLTLKQPKKTYNFNVYPAETVKLDPALVAMYLLKQTK